MGDRPFDTDLEIFHILEEGAVDIRNLLLKVLILQQTIGSTLMLHPHLHLHIHSFQNIPRQVFEVRLPMTVGNWMVLPFMVKKIDEGFVYENVENWSRRFPSDDFLTLLT